MEQAMNIFKPVPVFSTNLWGYEMDIAELIQILYSLLEAKRINGEMREEDIDLQEMLSDYLKKTSR